MTEVSAMLAVSIGMLATAMVLAGIRIVRGPTAADRVVALDMLGLLGTSAAGIAVLVSGTIVFIDIALAVALIGILATVAFAGFIERGSIVEGDEP